MPQKKLLMVRPEHFRIAYAINPHMLEADGSLKQVDGDKAVRQWEALRTLYGRLGLEVDVLPGEPDFPDMVFAANQSFVFREADRPAVVLSAMASRERQGEIEAFESYYRNAGYHVYRMSSYCSEAFEGTGDAMLHPNGAFIWGGYGFRSSQAAYEVLARLSQLPVAPLRLLDPKCYHLDTCFTILNADTVSIQESAFDRESLDRIHAGFKIVIPIDPDENERFFAGNAFCPNGTDVVLHPGARRYVASLKAHGFRVHEMDTGEFLKSGGSVFCMKMVLF